MPVAGIIHIDIAIVVDYRTVHDSVHAWVLPGNKDIKALIPGSDLGTTGCPGLRR